MNTMLETGLASLLKRWKFVVIVTVLATALAVVKELVVPVGYEAQSILVVTSLNLGKKAQTETRTVIDELLPNPLGSKVYVDLLMSNTVLGEVLQKLVEKGVFPEDEIPVLDDFAATLEADAPEVDKTTRPVTLSPLITLSAIGETEAQAKAIVETWSEVGVAVTQRTNTIRLAAADKNLIAQEASQKAVLEAHWQAMEEERAQWDIEVLRREMDNRVDLLLGLISERTLKERELQADQVRIETIREMLAEETPFLELFQAPSSTAYFLAEELGKGGGDSSNIAEKGMISQVQNPVYWQLKGEESQTVAQIAARQALLESIATQIGTLETEQKELTRLIAEHDHIQTRIKTDTATAAGAYSQIAATQVLFATANALAQGATEEGTHAIGLNRIGREIYAQEYKGLIGRKGRVLVVAFLAAAASVGYVLALALGKPLLAQLRARVAG